MAVRGCVCSRKGSDNRRVPSLGEAYPGLVLSTKSRFYAIVRPLYEDGKSDTWAWTWTDVKIVAQGLPSTSEALDSLLPFSSISFNNQVSSMAATETVSKPEVAKTGLGSSAAMTTAVAASLLHYLGVVDISLLSKYKGSETENSNLDTLHTVLLKGRFGSGFDVSSSVYGSGTFASLQESSLQLRVNLDATALQKVIGDLLARK